MTEGPFPGRGPGEEEPDGSPPLPAGGSGPSDDSRKPAGRPSPDRESGDRDDNPESQYGKSGDLPEDGGWEELPPEEGQGQGLFWSVPAGSADLAGFTGEGDAPAIAPGPLLAGLSAAVAGGDGAGLAGSSDDFLFAVISAGRRMSSWGTWLEFSAMRELAVRHPAPPDRSRRSQPGAGSAAGSSGGRSPSPGSNNPDPGSPELGSSGSAPAAAASARQPAASPPVSTGPAAPAAAQPDADGRVRVSEFVADEVAFGLRLTWTGAADRIAYACDLAGRLPVTFAALGAGLIDPVHAKIICEQTDILSAADAATADPVLAAEAQSKTYGELRAAAARLVIRLDPGAVERRKQARRKEAHVRPFREESGNAGMTARELPSDEVLASWQHVDQRARELRAAGMPGSLRELRCRAYLDLLQERDSRDTTLPGPDDNGEPRGRSDGPGPGGPDGNGGPAGPGGKARAGARPSLAALVNLTVTLGTASGTSGTSGEAAGFGLLDPGTARDLLAAAARSPHTRWCVTALYPDGTAAAHGCAAGQHPPPPGPEPPGPEPPDVTPHPPSGTAGTAGPGTTRSTSGGPDQRPPPGAGAQDYLRSLGVRLTPIARGACDHRHAETGYQPSRKLQHLIRTRNIRCTAPGCGRSAARCDLDHTLAWDKGGITCECDLAPLCRHHHRCKQAEGWRLEQPEPGVLVWRTPGGRRYTTTPSEYAI